MDEQNILETQLILGKQVLEIVLDLLRQIIKALRYLVRSSRKDGMASCILSQFVIMGFL